MVTCWPAAWMSRTQRSTPPLVYGEADPAAENINSVACLAVVAVCVEASHSIARCSMPSGSPALTNRLPRLIERLVEKCTRRTQRRLGDPQVGLHRRILAQASPRAAGDLRSRQLPHDLYGMSGDAKGNRGQHGCKQRDCRHRIQRAHFGRWLPKRQRASGRDKDIGNRIVMAAGTAQPDTVPSVEDFAICGRKEQDSGDRYAIGSEARLIAVQNPAAADDPGRMLATTS